jgi:predicted metal-binding membrane protein
MQPFSVTPVEDTPRAAFGLLPWRVNLIVVVLLIALSALAWRSTVGQSFSMRSMAMGLGQIGWLSQGYMSASVFLAMWMTMMVAMMLPTVAPMVLAYLAVTRRHGRGVHLTFIFIAGYLFVWSAVGVWPFLVYKAFTPISEKETLLRWLPTMAGTALVLAGVYQFTGWKRICLDHCQSPFAFIATHDFGGGGANAFHAGFSHGVYCLGCCWALCAVLLVVGLMNLLWMVGIFAIFFLEKNWKRGLVVARLVGVALILLGAGVIARPNLLAVISL